MHHQQVCVWNNIGNATILPYSDLSEGPNHITCRHHHVTCDVMVTAGAVTVAWIYAYDAVISPSWWRHQMETFSALLAICAGNSPVPGEFPAQRPVTRSFAVFFDLRANKRLSKQWRGWWFETPSRPLWRHCNDWSLTAVDIWSHDDTWVHLIRWYHYASRSLISPADLTSCRWLFNLSGRKPECSGEPGPLSK